MRKPAIGRDTVMCISLSGRPGNFGTRFQNSLYDQLGLDSLYKSFTTGDLAGAVRGIRALGIRGCAISMLFKEAVIPLLDGLAETARAIDSVNTIVNEDGVLTGHNTDYRAVRTLLARAGIGAGTRFILRGSGGMAKAVVAALRDEGVTEGTIVARNRERGVALARAYGYDWTETMPDAGATLLANVTPLGMDGADANAIAFPEAMIAACETVFEAVAQPIDTPLVRAAQAAGRRVISGDAVMVLQAVEQFRLYTGADPSAAQIDIAAVAARS
jgi:shikimate dehydrogenase